MATLRVDLPLRVPSPLFQAYVGRELDPMDSGVPFSTGTRGEREIVASPRVGWGAVGTVALVSALALTFAWLIYTRVIRANLPMSWDEGAHSLFALTIADDLRRGDLLGFAYDTYRQVYWPPLHSWLAGVAFLAFGESIAVSRGVSLIAYAFMPVVLVAAGRTLFGRDDPLRGWVAAGVAGVLAVALPAFIPYASLALLELPALVALTLALWAAFAAEREPGRPRRRVLVAVAILAAFFLKTNYGILLMAVFAIDALLEARFSPRRVLSRRNMYVAVPILAVLAVWFAYPPKIGSTLRAMVNQPSDVSPFTLEGLLYYPRSVLRFAGSPLMLGLLLAGVAGAWPMRRSPNVRLLLVLAAMQLLLGELHQTKEHRHLLPLVPALILLTAATAASAVGGVAGGSDPGGRRVGMALAGVATAIVVAQLAGIVRRPFPTAWDRMPRPPSVGQQTLVTEVSHAADRGDRVLMVSAFDLPLTAPVLDWELAVRRGLLAVDHAGAIAVVDRDRSVAGSLRRTHVPSSIAGPVLRVLGRSDTPARVRTMYAGLPEHIDAPAFASSFVETLRRGRFDTVLLATVVSDSARYPAAFFAPAILGAGLTPVSSRVVTDDVSIRIDEYRVRAAAR